MERDEMSQKIRDLRAKYNLSLDQVANQIGVGKSTVRRWEVGITKNMRRDKIAKLAEVLHTTPAYLMGWTDSPDPEPELSPPLTLTADEENIIRSYRTADAIDRTMVRRILKVDELETEEAANAG